VGPKVVVVDDLSDRRQPQRGGVADARVEVVDEVTRGIGAETVASRPRHRPRSPTGPARQCAALSERIEQGERELAELQPKRNAALRQRHEVERKLNDTRAMMQQVETELDASVVRRIRQIWEELPPDVFDERMRSG
jgi:chromosome segregation ATPase